MEGWEFPLKNKIAITSIFQKRNKFHAYWSGNEGVYMICK
jgi:hypothetical protein